MTDEGAPLGSIRTSTEREDRRTRGVRAGIGRDRGLWLALLAGCVWLAAYAVATALLRDDPTGANVLGNVVYVVPVALAALLTALVARRASGRQRAFWAVLAVSNALWLAGELVWAFYELALGQESPFPSVADAFYLCSYALVIPAVLLGFAGSTRLRDGRALIDASILAVAVGYAGYTLLIEPQLAFGPSLATATGIAYPLLGVAILVVVGTVAFGGHRLVPRSVAIVGLAFFASAVTDAGYTYLVVLNEYVSGGWLNLGWQLEAVLLCLAALLALRHDEGAGRRRLLARDVGLIPVLAGAAATLVIAFAEEGGELSTGALLAGGYVLVALVLRLWLTAREKDRIARELERSLVEQQRLAVTDGLTGLHNRRFFEEMLRIESERAVRAGRQLALLVIDLDYFKQVNDEHGHPVGDAVLRETAQRLSAAVRASDVLARYGGEEFVVLLPETDPEVLLEIAERCRRAVSETAFALGDGDGDGDGDGESITVTASLGGATLPADAADAAELMRSGDRALYLAKDLGRNRVQVGVDPSVQPQRGVPSTSVFSFLEDLSEEVDARQGTPEHSIAMARWCARLADALGLDHERRERCVLAARFHDVGKIAVPNAILTKPGPLTEEEWRLVREHPARGADIMGLVTELADVAPIVRDHHERWDGTGYPAGKRGEEIPLEARIVAVCDAWSAMNSRRPYRPPLDAATALDELRTGSGTQFDPQVVEAFLALDAASPSPPMRPLTKAPFPARRGRSRR